MGRPEECASLIKKGLNPREIAEELGISISSVMKYLYTAVGKGDIRRSDILLSIEDTIRQDFEEIREMLEIEEDASWIEIYDKIKELPGAGKDVDIGLFQIYLRLRKEEVWLGDVYWYLYHIEILLHEFAGLLLKREYGENEDGWWRRIPLSVRQDCQKRREEDKNPGPPYSYTNLIDIQKIFEKEWSVLSILLPKTLRDKRVFRNSFGRLNYIRNKVMHPVRGPPTIDDLMFVRDFALELVKSLKRFLENDVDYEDFLNGNEMV